MGWGMWGNGEEQFDPLGFIRRCVHDRRILWTYHVNMRMTGRSISREMIIDGIEYYEIIEAYPEDKYLPSYLVHARHRSSVYCSLSTRKTTTCGS